MRILHTANHCRRSGNGIVNVAVDLACTQARLGHAVAFASAGGEYADLLTEAGVEVYEVDQRSRKPLPTLKAAYKMLAVLSRFRPEIVNSHMMTGAVICWLFKAFYKFKLVTTVHNEFQRSASVMRIGDRVIAVSDPVANALRGKGFGEKVRTVRNGTLGTPRLTPKSMVVPANLKHPSIVTVAGLSFRKGIGDIIFAAKLLAERNVEFYLTIVGDGPQRAIFEEQAADLAQLGRITFTGLVPDPRPYFAAADIFVLASHQEPGALVLVEAREWECAIVATDVGGTAQALENGEAGILIPPQRPDLLADTLQKLLASHETMEGLRRKTQDGLDFYSVTRVCEQTLSVYSDALPGSVLA